MKSVRLIGHIILIPFYLAIAYVILALLSALVYDISTSDWDSRIEEMCEAEGGVKIFETVYLTREEFQNFNPIRGELEIPFERSPRLAEFPYFSRSNITVINEAKPKVIRNDTKILRRSDEKIMATSTFFGRVSQMSWLGIPYGSGYSCLQVNGVDLNVSRELFVIEGE